MSEQTKSFIRHLLVSVGAVLTLLGLAKFADILTFLNDNLDGVSTAISTLVGFLTALFGFFKDSARFGTNRG